MLRRLVVVFLGLLVLGMASASAAPAAAKQCTKVVLGIRDDRYSAVHDLLAKRTSCRVARRVAEAAEKDPSTPRYRAHRFTCTGVQEDGPVNAMRYTCKRRAARVRFRLLVA